MPKNMVLIAEVIYANGICPYGRKGREGKITHEHWRASSRKLTGHWIQLKEVSKIGYRFIFNAGYRQTEKWNKIS